MALRRVGAQLPADIAKATIERLVRLDLLEERDGRWQVQVELTRRWLAQK